MHQDLSSLQLKTETENTNRGRKKPITPCK